MTTRFDIGEEVIILDFNNNCKKVGCVVGIGIKMDKMCITEFGERMFEVSTYYDIECKGDIYERGEKHIFKNEDECKTYLIEKFAL